MVRAMAKQKQTRHRGKRETRVLGGQVAMLIKKALQLIHSGNCIIPILQMRTEARGGLGATQRNEGTFA